MAQSLRPFNSMMTISILAVASEDLPATCKLGQFLHYLGDLYLSVERRGKICKHVHGGPHLPFAPPFHRHRRLTHMHTITTCGILNSLGKRHNFKSMNGNFKPRKCANAKRTAARNNPPHAAQIIFRPSPRRCTN